MQRREFLEASVVAGGLAVAGCVSVTRRDPQPFETETPAFATGDTLPQQFTCEGTGDSPPFEISAVPSETASLMVTGTVNAGVANQSLFWTLWNVPPETTTIPAGLPRTPSVDALDGALQGRVRLGDVGYEPPCPPPGQRYDFAFQIYALDSMLDVEGGVTNESAAEAIEGEVLASQRVAVGFERSAD